MSLFTVTVSGTGVSTMSFCWILVYTACDAWCVVCLASPRGSTMRMVPVYIYDAVPDSRVNFVHRGVERGTIHHARTAQRECQFTSTALCLRNGARCVSLRRDTCFQVEGDCYEG